MGDRLRPGTRIPPLDLDPQEVVVELGSRPQRWLRGRDNECRTLLELLHEAQAGRSGVLVVQGEAGIGKTALLDYAVDAASQSRLLRAAGVESELKLAYAGLHQLCNPLLDGLDRLPPPQAQALGTAFGLRTGRPPDQFLVGLAVWPRRRSSCCSRPARRGTSGRGRVCRD